MSPQELILGIFLVATLFGVAGWFSWRQFQTLARLRRHIAAHAGENGRLTLEERQYLFRQVRRRFLCCALMILFAFFLIGWFFMEGHLPQGPRELPPGKEQGVMLQMVTYYWIGGMLLLLVMLVLACADFLATARYGLRSQRRLQQERKAVIDMEIAKIRQQHRQRSEERGEAHE